MGGEEGTEDYGTTNPMQFYGEGENPYAGSWADVTGGNASQTPASTAHGLAGFYNPQIMKILQQSLPNRG